ncbi:MoaD/ThiS family protein [Sporolactobacillus sp. CQH2019]|uniref:MoaD/ThiS family protein n=1 Tax=Sporolactobacillus sp. CQH2019 TaxID=3023512 RepID=UPI0023684171|nr:MoaD/ThiS family protein [Sporolactobacillus sp. CQH2019]MDD9149615.1 MoaD/ThiS family protein [Sporolactobacillus sp. CQH2019]
MIYSVRLFAMLSEQLGAQVNVELSTPVSAQAVRAAVIRKYPQVRADIVRSAVAINQNFVNDEIYLPDDIEEIALIPPVSGG